MSYDGNAPMWQQDYHDEMEAWQAFFSFTDWGMANEYATLNIYTPELKCYTKNFYRTGLVVTK
jgi:hypothetical protein